MRVRPYDDCVSTHHESDGDVAAVTALSDAYESALVANDVGAMDAVFWDDPRVVRFGIAEIQYGIDEIADWRKNAAPVPTNRRMLRRDVVQLAPGVVAVDLVFRNGDDTNVGRQSQIWVEHDIGWRIVRAHVSSIVDPQQ